MMPDICRYEGKKVLLVEGKNDCHVVLALCKYNGLPKNFGIHQCENDIGILKRLNALIIQPDPPESIGIIIDADEPNVIRRWQQIQQKIKEHGYTFPEFPNVNGTILSDNPEKPNLGIWLMPNNQNPGMLEDFLLEMADKKSISTACQCIEMARDKGLTTFRGIHFSKALIHTYLAWQNEPGRPLGQSITAHSLKPDTEIANILVEWLKRLFSL
jgi:hypothetical protein